MNRKFRKALKKAYDIPKPLHKNEFIDRLKKRYPQNKPQRQAFFSSERTVQVMASALTVLVVLGMYGIYNNILFVNQISISEPSYTESDEFSQASQAETYPEITKDSGNNKITTSAVTVYTDSSESAAIVSDSSEKNYIIHSNTDKITRPRPKVTAAISKQENKITKSTVIVKPINSAVASEIRTKPFVPSENETVVTTNNSNDKTDEPNEDVNIATRIPTNQSTSNNGSRPSSTTISLGINDVAVTTVSSTAVTVHTSIPQSSTNEKESIVKTTYPDIYFNKSKILYDDS